MQEFLTFASRGRNAWWRYAISCFLAVVIWLLLTILVAIGLIALGISSSQVAAALRHPSNAGVFYPSTGIAFGSLLVSLMVSIAIVQRKRPGDVIGRWRWSAFLFGAGVWAVLGCVSTLLDFLIAPGGFVLSLSGATPVLAVSALIGLSIQTFAEEFIFRGFLTQGFLLALKRPLPAAIASGLLFGALHIPNGLWQAVNAGFFGCICSLIAIRTGGIALTFGVHLVNNYFGAVIVVLANDVFKGSPGIFTQNTPSLSWFDFGTTVLGLFVLLWLVFRSDSGAGGKLSPRNAAECAAG
jgi:CAAX protease family protein